MVAAAKPKPARSKAKKERAKKPAAPKAARPLVDALAEAAWLEADLALAEALADFDELEGARDDADKAHAMVLLAQSLARAGRKRGLARLGILGATEPYDPSRHEYIAPGKPKTVRIKARGVARGGEILVKPRAGPSRRKKAL